MTSPSSSSSSSPEPGASSATATCPSCHAPAVGKFCSNCGAALSGAACGECGASLAPGAKFCHRCGTAVGSGRPAGADRSTDADERSFSSALPWSVAAIALVAIIALVAGQRFGRTASGNTPAATQMGSADPNAAAPFAGATGNGQAPDISNMTPAEAASRLYDRIMEAHEGGHADTVQMFAPMAITAYSMIGTLNNDQHYDVGRIAAVAGNEALARAESDTILAGNPKHLLGLILAGNAATMRKDTASMRKYYDELKAAAPAEQAKQLPEYSEHANDIQIALGAKRP